MPRSRKYATDEAREEARREQTNASHRRARAKEAGQRRVYRAHDFNKPRPDPQAIAERDERLRILFMTGLTPNQLLLGDPGPGRSVLETTKR